MTTRTLSIAFAACLGLGCSSVRGSAVRTGELMLAPHVGVVTARVATNVAPDAVDLGVVEVHAVQEEGAVEVLVPLFLEKVAQIGGDIAVVDGVTARFDRVTQPFVETFYAPCRFGTMCSGTRVFALNDEVMTVSMVGHAYATRRKADHDRPLLPLSPRP